VSGTRVAMALSTAPDGTAAAAEVCRAISDQLGPGPVTLAVVFASPALCADPEAEAMLALIGERLAPDALVGGMGEAIVAESREVEDGPALAIWAARLPGARITPFRLSAQATDEGLGVVGWPAELERDPAPDAPVIMVADPFTFPADALLSQLNLDQRGVTVVGGLASGGASPGEHRLFHGSTVLSEGAVGVIVRGIRMVTAVSQGCAPIGPDMVITAGEGQVVNELAGVPALSKLEEVIAALPPEQRALAGGGLLVGLVIDENQPEYERGDFLIRGIHGGDPATGALYVGERVRVGQTLRFHVRDARSADEDLRLALREARRDLGAVTPAGALLFTCNGRGTHMFSGPDHDAGVIREELGVPAVGFFCNGEIGPIGGRNFLHGFTAIMALFGDGDVA
jgi:small ligand-binding sensory domain FIST